MKKIALMIFALSLSLAFFAGCGEKKPVEREDLITYESQNGYILTYPQNYNASSLSHDMDFVIMDERTGSTVTVQTIDGEKAQRALSEAEFIEQYKEQNMDIDVDSFEYKDPENSNVLVVEYNYKESKITSMEYEADGKIYNATYTELPGTSETVRADMLEVIASIVTE